MPLWSGAGSTFYSWDKFKYLGPYTCLEWVENWKYRNIPTRSLDDCIDNQIQYLKQIKKEGAAGVKFATIPKINSDNKPDRKKAEEEFNDFKNGKIKTLPQPSELQYYLMDRSIANAIEEGFVISVHTGYWRDFRDLSPLNLIPFIMRYPEGIFDVYHLGYPWIRESIMLAKGFSNVYLDLCWTYIISQKATTDALDEIIETVPVNKVIGFGGDLGYEGVETIYGHLQMAKESIAEVIARRVSSGYMDYDSGIRIINKYFYENPKKLYEL